MLNPELKLNQKIFEDPEKKAIRDGFGEALLEFGEKNKNIVVLTADVSESTRVKKFAEKFPSRFFNCGIAEQNMAGIAAGLAVSGKIPFISSYAVFSPGRNWEIIRTTIIYNNANVKIVGHHSGIITGEDGVTHQATEDIAIIRCLPNITIFSPCDYYEAKKVVGEALKINGPVYIRLTRENTPIITTEETPFQFNKIQEFWISENPVIAIFVTGHLIYQALLAAKELEKEEIKVLVLNVSTLKPLDEKKILEITKDIKGIIVVEDHQIYGGLGSSISEFLSQYNPKRIEFIGLKSFAESGKGEELIIKYKLDRNEIIKRAKKLLGYS